MAKKAEKAPTEEVALDDDAPKKSKKKLILIILSVVLLGVLGAGGFFGYKWWMGRPAAQADNATEQKTEDGHDAKAAEGGEGGAKEEGAAGGHSGGELVSIPPLLVNLAEPQGRRYLKLALDIEVKDKLAADELNKNMSKVKDSLLLLLSSKTYDDLSTLESKILLKKEIVERLTLVMGEQKVLRVYITEIVIQ
ncbi:flagellar FliL protein [Humidesulfovibrio mexicanus]|uniref:Flagellar protein FliL n=1 Tax=Humidesulfovibrio mexicanus TaxID=147047 RepID=A0A238ZTW7_9BACT|nr:flagellar basal body-associated FliL family protein [Humidesulfovibrio mexicanus]SNR86582.1 flagellar FliL protein [Humidesulfovibrio mexicanus]